MKKSLFLSLAIVLFCSFSYTQTMKNKTKASLGSDFRFTGFHFFSAPTDNFGLGTTYKQVRFKKEYQCAMLRCFTDTTPSYVNWLTFNNMADLGKGGIYTISDTDKLTIAQDAIIPTLWKVLDLKDTFKIEQNKITDLSLGTIYHRKINAIKFKRFVDGLPEGDAYQRNFNQRNYWIVKEDIVVDSLSLVIQASSDLKAKLDAKVDFQNANIGSLGINFEIDKVRDGVYRFYVNHPLIIAVKMTRQSTQGELENSSSAEIEATDADYAEIFRDFKSIYNNGSKKDFSTSYKK